MGSVHDVALRRGKFRQERRKHAPGPFIAVNRRAKQLKLKRGDTDQENRQKQIYDHEWHMRQAPVNKENEQERNQE